MNQISSVSELENKLSESLETLVIYVHSPWCSICQMYGFTMQRFSDKYPMIPVFHINISSHPELSDYLSILNVPTTLIYKHGVLSKKLVSAQTLRTLERIIQ